MKQPPRWSPQQLAEDSQLAVELFRKERLEEPLEDYLEAFNAYSGSVEELFRATLDLTDLDEGAIEFLSEPKLFAAFRYLAGPPISADDLKTVSEVQSLNPAQLERDPHAVQRLLDVVRVAMDPRRFPWIREGRKPTSGEKKAALLASAALMATQRVGTARRSKGKQDQEAMVGRALVSAGFAEVSKRKVLTLTDAPQAGEFCGESLLGNRKADFIVRLWDHRLMPIECKVSNSAVNSVKRLNNDAAAKAEAWYKDFGVRQVVPTAVLSGVYKLHNLEDAQDRGLTLFWAHALRALTDWIELTRR